MATRTFGSSAGNWSDATKWVGGVKPTTQDDVVLDASSGNCAINETTATLKSFDLTGYTGTLSGTSTLNVGPSSAGTVVVKFAGTVTWSGALTINPAHTSAVINFTSAGKVLCRDITCAATGNGKVVQQDDFAPQSTSNKPSLLISGTAPWDMNGFKIIGNSVYRYLVGTTVRGSTSVLTLNGGAAGAATQFQYFNARDILFNNGGSNLDLSGITGNSGDCQGNGMSGGGTLTFTTSVQQTYNGTTGNYSNDALWTTRSPLPQDDVIISNFGGAGRTLNYDKREAGRNVDFSGLTSAANKPIFSASAGATAFTFYGSLTLASSTYLNWQPGNFAVNWEGRSNSNVTCAGQDLGSVVVAGTGATLQCQDAFTASLAISNASGTFDTQGYSSNVGAWGNGTGGNKEYKGSGSITITGATTNEFNINSGQMTWSHTGAITANYAGDSDRSFFFGTVDASRTMSNIITVTGGGVGFLTFVVSTWARVNGLVTINAPKRVNFTSGTTIHFAGGLTANGTANGATIIGGSTLNGNLDTAGAGGADVFANWSETTSGTTSINRDTSAQYEGTSCCRFDTDASAGAGAISMANALVVGHLYKFTFWGKKSGAGAGVVVGTSTNNTLGGSLNLTTSWVQYTGYMTANDTTFRIGRNGNSSSFYVDAVTLVEWGTIDLSAVTAGNPVMLTNPNGGNLQFDYLDITDVNVTSLIKNPTFDVDTAGWAASAGGAPSSIASVAGGQSGNCLQVTNTGAVDGFGYATMQTVIGKTYEINLYHKNGTATGKIQVSGANAGGTEVINQTVNDANWTLYTIQFTATATTMWISLRNSNVSGGTGLWDEVNVKVVPEDKWYYGLNSVLHSGLGWLAGLAPSAFMTCKKGLW